MGQTDRPDDRRVAGSRLPPTANLLSKGITKRLNPESQTARKSRPAPGFLEKSNTCSRQITAINQRLPNTSRTTRYPSHERQMRIGNAVSEDQAVVTGALL